MASVKFHLWLYCSLIPGLLWLFARVYRGRLKHGRHFTFKSVLNDVAITLVSTSVVGSIADEHHPYAAHGPWLQVTNGLVYLSTCLQVLFAGL